MLDILTALEQSQAALVAAQARETRREEDAREWKIAVDNFANETIAPRARLAVADKLAEALRPFCIYASGDAARAAPHEWDALPKDGEGK